MAKILIFSQDVVGKSMAGPGIRYFEFAKALSKHHKVTLATPTTADIESKDFELMSYEHKRVSQFLHGYDFVVTQSVSPTMAWLARRQGTRIILDYYDPILLEGLEIFAGEKAAVQRNKNSRFHAEMRLSMLFADALICASEKQRDLWIGALMALGRITPEQYKRDVSLRQLIDVVPFGIQDENPVRSGEGFRKRLGLKPSDRVLIWGGGIWNWFDPLTLIEAVAKMAKHRDDVKLVFMGLKHPNDAVEEMEMARRAVALAKKLGLYDKHVFFNYGWVPYNERQNHFLEADIGMSTHFDHLETRFSFRTRILDYIWSQLPIVATQGDSMADVISARGLGTPVDYANVDALVEAITGLLDDKKAYSAVRKQMAEVREEYRWAKVTQPILGLIDTLEKRPIRRISAEERRAITELYRYTLKDIREAKGTWPVITNVATKAYKIAFKRT